MEITKILYDRSISSNIKDLKIGEIQTVTIIPYKYNFPRIRNLPNRVSCRDETGDLECIFLIVMRVILRKFYLLEKNCSKWKNRFF